MGDLAIATAEVFGDEGVLTPDGWHSLELIGIPALSRNGENHFNRFPLTRWAIDKALYVAEAEGIILHQGEFVTVSTASGTAERGKELFQRFGGICENMEGAAAAQVALLYGVDCMEIRGISNWWRTATWLDGISPLPSNEAQRFIVRFIAALCSV